jgi:cytochrome c-type biogenesis protein CcmH
MPIRSAQIRVLATLLVVLLGIACHRNVEPYEDEPVAQPDLAKIFPEGAERSGERLAQGSGPPGAPAAGMRGAPRVGSGSAGVAAASGAAAPGAAGSDAAGMDPIRGEIRLAPELEGRVPQGAILFLIARAGPSGPPTAVVRIPGPSLPLEFSIGPDDRMIAAMPFEGPFQVTARIDADGNAMTRNPGDLHGAAAGTVLPGASGVEIVIDEVL